MNRLLRFLRAWADAERERNRNRKTHSEIYIETGKLLEGLRRDCAEDDRTIAKLKDRVAELEGQLNEAEKRYKSDVRNS